MHHPICWRNKNGSFKESSLHVPVPPIPVAGGATTNSKKSKSAYYKFMWCILMLCLFQINREQFVKKCLNSSHNIIYIPTIYAISTSSFSLSIAKRFIVFSIHLSYHQSIISVSPTQVLITVGCMWKIWRK